MSERRVWTQVLEGPFLGSEEATAPSEEHILLPWIYFLAGTRTLTFRLHQKIPAHTHKALPLDPPHGMASHLGK